MPTPGPVTLDCPAKLNLALAVGRPDPADPQGLHPIASWMTALAFADRLTFERLNEHETTDAPPGGSVFRLAYADDAPSPGEIDWPIEHDLMFRAHGLVEQHVGRALPVRVDLQKFIPTGGGLGGGSSNAAGMIVALDRLFDLGLTGPDRHRFASALGSDVHFALAALAGQTSAIVTGSGDQLEPAAPTPDGPIHVVLVLPPFGCPTGPVYAAFDRLTEASHALDAERVRGLPGRFTPDASGLFNDLAPAAMEVEPRLAELIEGLRGQTPRPVHVTGSGAVCFVVTDTADRAQQLAANIRDRLGVPAIATHTL